MKNALRALISSIILSLLLFLSGCASNAQAKAVTEAVVAYSDYYIEVRSLEDQLRAQAEQQDATASSFDCVISVDIPDYTQIDPADTGFTLPEANVSTRSANAYQAQASLALRQAMEQYVLEHGASAYLQLPVTFSVSRDGGWSANMTSQSKLDIQRTVEDMMKTILQQDENYLENDRLMQASSALIGLLTDVFGGAEYADAISVNAVARNPDETFTASISYPDPAFVFQALADAYVASFNQPFYGNEKTASLAIEGLRDVNLASAPVLNASVQISYDAATEAFALLDDGGLAATITQARETAQSAASNMVNEKWRVAPLDPPDSGSILEGESGGNSIVFKTGNSLGKYFYVRFYAISGEDTSEEGTLSLGVFIVGGKNAKVKLPTGYYRVSCLVGESWYGLEQLFGSDVKTYNGGNAIQSRKGYVNNIMMG